MDPLSPPATTGTATPVAPLGPVNPAYSAPLPPAPAVTLTPAPAVAFLPPATTGTATPVAPLGPVNPVYFANLVGDISATDAKIDKLTENRETLLTAIALGTPYNGSRDVDFLKGRLTSIEMDIKHQRERWNTLAGERALLSSREACRSRRGKTHLHCCSRRTCIHPSLMSSIALNTELLFRPTRSSCSMCVAQIPCNVPMPV